jgi:hypothetical protein
VSTSRSSARRSTGRRDQVEDFLKVRHFSYGCKQEFSGSDRWCLVGEAGAFLDPFYSPGSDYIAISYLHKHRGPPKRGLWSVDRDLRRDRLIAGAGFEPATFGL